MLQTSPREETIGLSLQLRPVGIQDSDSRKAAMSCLCRGGRYGRWTVRTAGIMPSALGRGHPETVKEASPPIQGVLAGSDGKQSICNVGDPGLVPGGEDHLEREWLPTPVFLPGNPHGQTSLTSFSPVFRRTAGETGVRPSGLSLIKSCLWRVKHPHPACQVVYRGPSGDPELPALPSGNKTLPAWASKWGTPSCQ